MWETMDIGSPVISSALFLLSDSLPSPRTRKQRGWERKRGRRRDRKDPKPSRKAACHPLCFPSSKKFHLISFPYHGTNKDNNILSLRFLLELNQIVHFRICYLPSCITWLHVWFVTWSIKLFPAQPLQSWDTCIFFTWKLGDFESTNNSYNQ